MEDVIKKIHHIKLDKPQTCLSPYVHKLIVEHTFSIERDLDVIDSHGLLNFRHICSKLSDEGTIDDMSYFTSSVQLLAPMMHSVADMMDTGCHDYSEWLKWTGHAEFLLELIGMMRICDEVHEMVVLLATVSILERALGNVYLLSGSQHCPSMLKDLLVSTQLRDILGVETLQVLRVLIGPPTSLNLRNVVWHGFPAPGEIPRRCIWFIVSLVPSIGKILQDKNITNINHREPVVFPETTLITDLHVLSDDGIFSHITKSELVHWDTDHFWRTIKQFYIQQRYSLCAALLMYYLEQILRFVFTAANQCEGRLLTAEATTLYTTFDEMLDGTMPDGTLNKLRDYLSDPIMEILLDHLSYHNGPRVRDRLGHGEACWKTFPWQLVDNLATVAIAVTALFIPKEQKVNRNLSIEKIFLDVSSYEVQYHRISILRKKVLDCSQKSAEIDSLVQYLPDLTDRDLTTTYPVSILHDEVCTKMQEACMKLKNSSPMCVTTDQLCASLSYNKCMEFEKLMRVICTIKIDILYRESLPTTSDYEGEVLSFLEHIIDETITVISNIKQFALTRQKQIQEKQLRSRQRDNFKKYLSSLPLYVLLSNVCCFLTMWQLHNLMRLKLLSEDAIKQQIRFWKSCLQFCENIRTCTQFDRNKWTDGVELINKFSMHLVSCMHIL